MTPEDWPDPVPQLISTFQSLQNVTVGIVGIFISLQTLCIEELSFDRCPGLIVGGAAMPGVT